MKRYFLPLLLVLPLALALATTLIGCDSSPNAVTQQAINEIKWLPNGNGMLAIVLRATSDINTGLTTTTAGLYRVDAYGTIGDAFNIPDNGIPLGYPTLIGISKDGNTAITELGTTVYRVNLPANSAQSMIKNEYLMGVSPSLKYVLVTETDATQSTRFASIYDVSGSTARRVKDFTMNGVISTRALWLGDTAFAVSGYDSIGRNEVQIYDTTGGITTRYSGFAMGGSSGRKISAYASDTGALFLFNPSTQGLERFDVTSGTHRTVLSNDSVEMMDASTSGNLVVYSSGGGNASFGMFALNPRNGNRTQIGSSAYEVVLSPAGDKVAYSTVESGLRGVNIRVVSVSVP